MRLLQASLIQRDDEHASVKERLGWVPPEEQQWQPYGKNGASPPKKSPADKKKYGSKSFV
jgi:hypothetical protein